MDITYEKAQKIKTLFKIVGVKNKPLNKSIEEVAYVLKMKNNSAKNFYYKTLNFLNKNPVIAKQLNIDLTDFKLKKIVKFKNKEKFDLLKIVEDNLKKGISVRATCMNLANNDAKLMLRLQNKYRNMVKNKTNNFEDVVSIEKKAFLNTIEKEKNKKVINIASVKTKQNGRISDHELNALFLGLVRIVKKTAMEDVSQEIKNECKMATENFRQTLIDLNKAEAELKREKIKNIELSQKVESQKDQICKLLKELSARKLSMLEKKSRINSLKLKSFSKTKNQNNNIL